MQKTIWKKIAQNFNERGHNITEEQCCVKWKNLKRKYKNIQDFNNQTGNQREVWEYFDMIDEFLNTKPEIALYQQLQVRTDLGLDNQVQSNLKNPPMKIILQSLIPLAM